MADPRRVLAKLFLPGQETLASGLSRAQAVINRVLAMSDEVVAETLGDTLALYGDRHRDLAATLRRHFMVAASHRVPDLPNLAADRIALIGAYFTQEYAVESAAVLNPSLVAHPDQDGVGPGELRFVMSARGVGEGHISSLEFRTGVVTADGDVRVDDPGRHVSTGEPSARPLTRTFLASVLAERPDLAEPGHVLALLPEDVDAEAVARVGALAAADPTRRSAGAVIERIRWVLDCNYRITFDPELPLAERVLYPRAPDESHGIEDARFTRFVRDDGTVTYLGTYTAFDGVHVAPHLITTDDFAGFEISQLTGPAAKDKGMAIFPRLVDGRYFALSRWDRESIGISTSSDAREWGDAVTVETPEQPWEVIQLGNCGPPLETEAGWLVLTHGVGPVRGYGIGAMLLDLADPTKLLGQLKRPLLTPNAEEREGYVPNVVYSCGPLLHDGTMVIPYGCSDSAIRFAYVDVPALLDALLADD
ncbi:MAG: glycosidase related protein [Friedmanniella sp.]|nr:glycosidase related protein [Friedmanniella sp.]